MAEAFKKVDEKLEKIELTIQNDHRVRDIVNARIDSVEEHICLQKGLLADQEDAHERLLEKLKRRKAKTKETTDYITAELQQTRDALEEQKIYFEGLCNALARDVQLLRERLQQQ